MEAKLERAGSDYAVRHSADDVRRLGLSEGQMVEVLPRKNLPESGSEGDVDVAMPRPGRRIVDGLPVFTMAEMVAEAQRLGPRFEPPTVDWGPDVGSEIIDDDDPHRPGELLLVDLEPVHGTERPPAGPRRLERRDAPAGSARDRMPDDPEP